MFHTLLDLKVFTIICHVLLRTEPNSRLSVVGAGLLTHFFRRKQRLTFSFVSKTLSLICVYFARLLLTWLFLRCSDRRRSDRRSYSVVLPADFIFTRDCSFLVMQEGNTFVVVCVVQDEFQDRTRDMELVAWLVLESVRRTYVGIRSDLRGNTNRVTGNERKIGRE
jgi:hypothetical protein